MGCGSSVMNTVASAAIKAMEDPAEEKNSEPDNEDASEDVEALIAREEDNDEVQKGGQGDDDNGQSEDNQAKEDEGDEGGDGGGEDEDEKDGEPHPHPLIHAAIDADECCNHCKDVITGSGKYSCETCQYDLCEDCYVELGGVEEEEEEEEEVPQPQHPHPHPLTFLLESTYKSGKYSCNECKLKGLTGQNYHCDPCKYDNCVGCYVKLSQGESVEDKSKNELVKPGTAPSDFPELDLVTKQATEQVAKIVADYKANQNKYVDPDFTPTTLSLWRDPFFPPPDSEILHPKHWRRLTAMVPHDQTPILWGPTGPSPGDIMQGGVGTCFLLSALGVLAGSRPEAVKALFVAYDIEAGVYALKFWKDGKWLYVLIDDYVPTTLTTETKRVVPAYAYCATDNMLWVPLVEKAYAKLHHCYENIDGGFSNCAMMDLTGGYSMGVLLHDPLSSPVFSVNKYTEGKETIIYLGFNNGILTGGGWSGPYREYVFKGTYTIDGKVNFVSYPVASKMNDPLLYLVNYTGQVDPVTKVISGTHVEDREKGFQTGSAIRYEVSSAGPPPQVPFKWEPNFFDSKQKPDVFDGLNAAMKFDLTGNNVLMSCSAHPPNAGMEEHTPDGLLLKHEYAVLSVFDLPNKSQLVMLKNPHGKGSTEWNGEWSDDSPSWNPFPEEKKKYVKNDGTSDGVFCMSFNDWRTKFTHLNMNRIFESSGWYHHTFQGLITPQSSGTTNNKAKTKYAFTLKAPTRLVISLSQPDNKRFDNTEHYTFGIGLRVVMAMKVGSGIIEEPAYDRDNVLVVAEVTPVHARQVSVEIFLDSITREYESHFGPGSYYIIPTTDYEGFLPYVLNVFSFNEKPVFKTMKPVFPPHEEPDSVYKGDWLPHWFYEVLPHYENWEDEEDQGEEEASPKAHGRSEIARAKGRNEVARAKGRKEVARSKGRYELARAKGRQEMARAKGRNEVARAKGRNEVARAKGRAELARAKGRAEMGRAKGANTEHRLAGKANALKKEGVQAAQGVQEIVDAVQDGLEKQFRLDYCIDQQ